MITIKDFLGRLKGVRRHGSGWMAKCPAHDDKNPSLSISQKNEKILIHCHARCTAQSVCNALGLKLSDLSASKSTNTEKSERTIEKIYDYRDVDGALLYQQIRYKPKAFQFRRPDSKGRWIYDLQGVERVLYRLPELLAAEPSSIVFIPEGEKDVENLVSLGLVATCNLCGGGGKWKASYSDVLSGRPVAILPDNDKTGREHAEQVARSLFGKAKEIKVLTLDGLPLKGDISDWLAAGHNKEELLQLVEQAVPYQPSTDSAIEAEVSGGDSNDADTIAQRILKIGLDSKLLRAPGGRAFILPKGGRPRELQSRGGGARGFLRAAYFRRFNAPVRDGDLTTAVETLIALAEREEKVPIYLRIKADKQQIVVDLGHDGNEAIVIDRNGARIAEDHGVLFVRIDGATAMMPVPNFDANHRDVLQAFHNLMGLSREDSFKLLCWLLQTWQPSAPYLVLYLTGGPGNGKTTTTSFIRLIGDPLGSDGARIGKSPKDEADLIAFSNCCHILATDNITYINQELSDTIAGIATGMGSFTRKLYTNSDIHIVDRMLPQIINGISPGGIKPDVRDRMLHISLRKRESILSAGNWWVKARSLLPDITGILAQACCYALRNLDTIPSNSEFRMADATRWIAAAQPYFTDGTIWEGLDFADIYRRSRQEDAQSSIDDDPVLRCFMNAVEQSGEIKGNASYILWKIENQAKEEGILDELKKTGQWPKNARALSVKLQGYEPLLKDAGIFHTELPQRGHLFQIHKHGERQYDDIPI